MRETIQKRDLESPGHSGTWITVLEETVRACRARGKTLMGLFLVMLFLCGGLSAARASWLIDARKFHASVHGQTSCQDCHEEIQSRSIHPDPEEIVKTRGAFFKTDHCLACHDDVLERLTQGFHGAGKVQDREGYMRCLECHDPHDQAPIGEESGRFDPSRPRYEQCGACHETRSSLPPVSAEDEACMVCHLFVMPDEPQAAEKISTTCFHCHAKGGTPAQELTARKVAFIDPVEYRAWPHNRVACTLCHPMAGDFDHGRQDPGDCRQCHTPHDEKVTHDLHARVACGACHLQGIQPLKDAESGTVLWERTYEAGIASRVHHMGLKDDEGACGRCHRRGNTLGAVSMILPAKGVLCMPCHAGTFSVGHVATALPLIVFFLGMGIILAYALSGTIPGRPGAGPFTKLSVLLVRALRALFSPRIGLVVRALILDVFLQRRLYRESARRWAIHAMIFFPFLIRFFWGFVGLAGSLWRPEWPWTWAMLDKNHPVTGFLFDMTGIIMALGLVLALMRGRRTQTVRPPGVPGQDRFALGLMGGIVVVGFILEGIRIAMTGDPPGAGYAFLGYAVGQVFGRSSSLTEVYGYVWYLHAILTGAFVAYLPFSRLVHVIIAPLVLARKALAEGEHKRR